MFSDVCFPCPEFQVGRVAFYGTNYYIFIFDTVYSPKPFQRFLKGRFVCILQSKPLNGNFDIESGGVLPDNLKSFLEFKKKTTLQYGFKVLLFSYKTAKFQVSGRKTTQVGTSSVS